MRDNRAALLIMDFQQGIVDRFGNAPAAVDAARRALDAARSHDVPVIYVRVAFLPGYPEVGPSNRSFARIAGSGDAYTETSPATQIRSALAPEPQDVVVTKRRVGAFSGSDLDVVLRAKGIETLVLSGIATSGVVLSTVRHAADHDFRLIVLSDACADADAEVHRILLEKVFPRQAEVLTVDQWTARLDESEQDSVVTV